MIEVSSLVLSLPFAIFGLTSEPTERSYLDSLELAIDQLRADEIIEEELLLYCIPDNMDNALVLFDIDYRRSERYVGVYGRLNVLWLTRCKKGEFDFLKRYLEFSKFVDGYFAESYFDEITSLAKTNSNDYCHALEKSDTTKTRRLDRGICE